MQYLGWWDRISGICVKIMPQKQGVEKRGINNIAAPRDLPKNHERTRRPDHPKVEVIIKKLCDILRNKYLIYVKKIYIEEKTSLT